MGKIFVGHEVVYSVIVGTGDIVKGLDSNKVRMFGIGNEKRDLTLLVRGDIRIVVGSDVSFFGCLHCGYIGNGMHCRGEVISCVRCGMDGMMYSFDGVWKNSVGIIDIGCRDKTVIIQKL